MSSGARRSGMMKTGEDVPTGRPLVSVVVPVYNAEQFLEPCARSVLGQSYVRLELILVDDGSTDGSPAVCSALAAADGRVRLVARPNGGPSAARNSGIKEARGELIFFLDADDRLADGAMDRLVGAYLSHGADLVVGDFRKFKSGGGLSAPGAAFSEDRLLRRNDLVECAFSYLRAPNRSPLFAYAWGRLFKADIIRQNGLLFDAALRTFEDVTFNFEYLRHAVTAAFVKDVVYEHRIYEHYGSATMTAAGDPRGMLGYRTALASIRRFLSGAGPGVREAVAHANVTLTIIQLVRICGQIDTSNGRILKELVKDVVGDPGLRSDLRFYKPSGGGSRLLPLLMRLNLPSLVVPVCRFKAWKRYGRPAPPRREAGRWR